MKAKMQLSNLKMFGFVMKRISPIFSAAHLSEYSAVNSIAYSAETEQEKPRR